MAFNLYESESDSDFESEDKYFVLYEAVHLDFYDFVISPTALFEDIVDYYKNIDAPIKGDDTPLTILIKDDRSRTSFYWENIPENEKQQLVNYTVVKGSADSPITLRMILETMNQDPHYHLEDVKTQHHHFMEGYSFINDCVMQFSYGS